MNLARFTLGPWTVDPALNRIRRDGVSVTLEPKVMRVLVRLAEEGGVVTRADLVDEVWQGLNVVDSAVNRAIYQLRKALGADAAGKPYIETVRQVGYRLTVPAIWPQAAARTREAFRVRDLALVFMAAVLVGGVQLGVIAPEAPMFAEVEAPVIVADRLPPLAAPMTERQSAVAERRAVLVAERQRAVAERRAILVAERHANRAALRQARVEERARLRAYVQPGALVVAGEGVELIAIEAPAAPPAPEPDPAPAAPPAPEAPSPGLDA